MIPLASDLMNKYLLGTDGKTAHYRVNMRHYHGIALKCGEQVMAKPVREGNRAKMDRNPKRKLSFKSNGFD
jgi:hypothetical protein